MTLSIVLITCIKERVTTASGIPSTFILSIIPQLDKQFNGIPTIILVEMSRFIR